jgi:hypothetical protein
LNNAGNQKSPRKELLRTQYIKNQFESKLLETLAPPEKATKAYIQFKSDQTKVQKSTNKLNQYSDIGNNQFSSKDQKKRKETTSCRYETDQRNPGKNDNIVVGRVSLEGI